MRPVARTLLALVAAGQAQVGVWGITAPRSFFDTFPGLGHHWVAPLGAYNEHLVRDYAAAELGFAVLLACAAISSANDPRLATLSPVGRRSVVVRW